MEIARCACIGDNSAAIIEMSLYHDFNNYEYIEAALEQCVQVDNGKTIETLITIGVNMPHSLMSKCISNKTHVDSDSCAKVLMANGIRLGTLEMFPQWMREFEHGIVQCRDVIVTLLGLKKRNIFILKKLDRFLIKQELAVATWATRK